MSNQPKSNLIGSGGEFRDMLASLSKCMTSQSEAISACANGNKATANAVEKVFECVNANDRAARARHRSLCAIVALLAISNAVAFWLLAGAVR